MTPAFHFTLFTSWTHENFTELHYNIPPSSYFSLWCQSLSTVFFHLWTRTCIPTR